jgi:hypothetical protein
MATTIEFTSKENRSFVAKVFNPLTVPYSLLDDNVPVVMDPNATNRYRISTNRTGWVHVKAVDGAWSVVGFANLSAPSVAGACGLIDEMPPKEEVAY